MRTPYAALLILLLSVSLPTAHAATSTKNRSGRSSSTKTVVAKSETNPAKDSVTILPASGSVDRKFQPVLEPVERILVLPGLEPQPENRQPMVYSIAESPASLTGEYIPLPAAGIRQEFPVANQLGYVRLGVGNHRSFVGDAQINLLRIPEQTLDVNFMHRSIFGDLLMPSGTVDVAYNVENNLQLNYRASMTKTVLEAGLGERFNFWNYYGLSGATPTDSVRGMGGQCSTDGSFHLGLYSKDLGNPVSWKFSSEGHLFRLGNGVSSSLQKPSETIGAAEHEIKLTATLDYALNDRVSLGADAHIRNFTYRLPSSFALTGTNPLLPTDLTAEFANREYFEFAPRAVMFYKNWRFTGGIKLSIPSFVSESVRPNLVASAITPLSRTMVFRFVLDGGVEPLSYREGIALNPWLDPSVRLRSAWKVFDMTIGLDYRPVSNLRISPEASMSTTNDAPFFSNALPGNAAINNGCGRMFDVEYMSSTHTRFGVSGEYTLENLLTLLGNLAFNSYTNYSKDAAIDAKLQANGRKAWYKPGVEARFRADVRPMDKLIVFADYRLEGFRYAPTPTAFCASIAPVNDLSIGASYKVSKEVGIFMHINNLLDQRYQVYYGCPVHGFTALFGGSVTF